MPTVEVHKGDIGTSFQMTFKDGTNVVDVSGATNATDKQIYFTSPAGTAVTENASFATTNSGSDGKIEFTTTSVDNINALGYWKWQGKITLSGSTWKSDTHEFRVFDNLV